jgi:hypothetical protein
LSKLFRVEIFFMTPDKQSRVCLLPLYDKEGKAWWVLGNREVSTPLLLRRPPFACFHLALLCRGKKARVAQAGGEGSDISQTGADCFSKERMVFCCLFLEC